MSIIVNSSTATKVLGDLTLIQGGVSRLETKMKIRAGNPYHKSGGSGCDERYKADGETWKCSTGVESGLVNSSTPAAVSKRPTPKIGSSIAGML